MPTPVSRWTPPAHRARQAAVAGRLLLATLAAAPLPGRAVTAPPSAYTNASAEAKVIVEYVDAVTLPSGQVFNSNLFATDLKTGGSQQAGLPATASAQAAGAGTLTFGGPAPAGTGSSASGSALASATPGFGTLHALASGSTGAFGGSADASGQAYASFVDYLVFSAPGGGPVQFMFGLGLEATATAAHGGASAAVQGGINRWTPTSSSPLWSGGASVFVGSPFQQTAAQLVTVNAGDIAEIGVSLFANGRTSVGAGFAPGAAQSGSFAADAAHTAEVFIALMTPGASYTASSGTVYRTEASWLAQPVPEPRTALLALVGLAVLLQRARRHRGGPASA